MACSDSVMASFTAAAICANKSGVRLMERGTALGIGCGGIGGLASGWELFLGWVGWELVFG